MTATGSLVDGVLTAWERAVDRRESAGGWEPAGAARSSLAALQADAEVLRTLEVRLTALGDRFGLEHRERMLLAVAVLPEAHPSAHLLAGLLSGDAGPARPSVALGWESAATGTVDPDSHALLDAGGVLRATGLIAVEGDDVLLSRRLRLPDRVRAHLLGSTLVPEEVVRVLAQPRAVDVEGFRQVATALEAGEPLVWVHAPAGTAGAALAVAACRELGVGCLVGDLDRVPGEGATGSDGSEPDQGPRAALVRPTLRALVLEASLEGSVLVLLGAQHAAGHLDLLERAVVPVVAVGRTPWDPHWSDRLAATVPAGRLSRAEREDLWQHAVGPAGVAEEVLAMRITPEEIDLVGARARSDATRADRAPSVEDVRDAVRRLGAGHRSRVGAATSPATLTDLVLPDHTRREVERLIGWARDRDEVLGLGDLQGKGGKGTGICALFSGSPGTGKTLAAHVVADSLGADLFQVDLSTVVDKYIGETEKNLERTFARAESLNAVLFFDEADALFGSRSSINDAHDRYANQEVAFLLQRMEAFEGITVLATNLRGNLDPAFARRLHFMVHFPDPDAPTRLRLWEHHLAQLPGTDPEDPVDLELLSGALEIAGGDIRNIVLAATYDAVAARRPVGMGDLRLASEREMAKLGRRIGDARWGSGRARG
ncbi:ATP-binding protein [Pseudactinotalea suaedae]|uniref:ATP-binding protein n=1 Tax=Pseudactinotalea suaedae TaxID=1524924 RepID=UPI0012E1936D|nr:ATP-binding protein [Pseudactinotalea suaedae]